MATDYKITGDDWRGDAALIVARSLEGEQVRVLASDGRLLAIVGTAGVSSMLEADVQSAGASVSSFAVARAIAAAGPTEVVATPVELGATWRS